MTIEVAMFVGSVLLHLIVVFPACWMAFTNWRHRVVAIWIAVLTGPMALGSVGMMTAWIVGKVRGDADPYCLIWFIVALGPLSTGCVVGLLCGLAHARLRRRARHAP